MRAMTSLPIRCASLVVPRAHRTACSFIRLSSRPRLPHPRCNRIGRVAVCSSPCGALRSRPPCVLPPRPNPSRLARFSSNKCPGKCIDSADCVVGSGCCNSTGCAAGAPPHALVQFSHLGPMSCRVCPNSGLPSSCSSPGCIYPGGGFCPGKNCGSDVSKPLAAAGCKCIGPSGSQVGPTSASVVHCRIAAPV